MPARKARTARTLHDARGGRSAGASGGPYADIAMALLHDNSENNPLVHTELGTFANRHVDASNIIPRAARRMHTVHVPTEQIVKTKPRANVGEIPPRSGDPARRRPRGEQKVSEVLDFTTIAVGVDEDGSRDRDRSRGGGRSGIRGGGTGSDGGYRGG